MDNILAYFDIRCRDCGGNYVEFEESEKYDSNENYCGSNYRLICRDCNNSYLLES